MNRYTLLILCLLAGALAASGQPVTAALLLTGKDRNDAAVKAFYRQFSMDTSRSYAHSPKSEPGLSLGFDPLNGYKSIMQVKLSNTFSGPLPMGLKFGQSSAEVSALAGPSLIVSPAYLAPVSQHLIVKGGLAILLNFKDNRLDQLYTLAATQALNNWEEWLRAPLANYKEGCISGDCQNGPSVMGRGRSVHVGMFRNGLPEGYAQSFLDDGAFFHGIYSKGTRKNGVYFFPGGNRFNGDFNEESKFLNGTLTYKNGDVFRGSFLHNKIHSGTMNFASGNTFTGTFNEDGSFVNGKYNIKGEGVFTGTFSGHNAPHTGTLTDTNGKTHRFENGKRVP